MDYKSSLYKKVAFLAFSVIFLAGVITPFIALAQEGTKYKLLEPLPGVTIAQDSATSTAKTYIEGMVKLIIAIASVLAVIKIILAGIKYMSTDAFSGKSEAKEDIKNAIWGLALAMSAWLILYTVNPNLVELNLSIPKQELGRSLETDLGTISTGTPEELGCADCEEVALKHKPFPAGCSSATGGICYIDKTLQRRMSALFDEAEKMSPSIELIITESFPPTRIHQATCQQAHRPDSGTCVDMAIEPRSSQTPENIKKVIRQAALLGLKVQFEVPTETRAETIRSVGNFGARDEREVIAVPGITGEHFSVYLNR